MSFFPSRSVGNTIFRLFPVLPIFVFSFRTATPMKDAWLSMPFGVCGNGLHAIGPIRATLASIRAVPASSSSSCTASYSFFKADTRSRRAISSSVYGSALGSIISCSSFSFASKREYRSVFIASSSPPLSLFRFFLFPRPLSSC